MPLFIDAVDSTVICVPEYIAWLLRDFGTSAQDALLELRQMSGDCDSTKQCAASDAIWAITGDPRDAIDIGLKLLDGEEWLERVVGAEHLGCLGTVGQPAIPRLLQALNDDDATVRSTVESALERIRSVCQPCGP
jgi:HEAT repeat protein